MMADRVLRDDNRPLYRLRTVRGWRDDEAIEQLLKGGVLIPVASGRLVDREAIDAVCDEIWELGQASWPWRDAPTPVLDAALRDSDG